ncbi:flagellar M-ring protein FliF C-terminal domain-containing protein [Enterocloster sp.]|jgi:flagellar biosynthesis/type III secretory pathway M-ring protein FliF/YscJ|uniref:flagellar M-ring protein FliF C-terminal domain-containing protein n=1 Tax=Enterocloster sp. TaxID=2719315 RepID=UPI00257FB558|nr:flagellar M-ring protein FliF C-terminal domain-containing protein [Enterocloster sp.]MBS5404563.1 flagellar M-ring protein FliF [Enterocloster sp.]
MQRLKEHWQNLSDKSRKMLMAIAGGTAAIAIIAVLVLKLGTNTDYSTLFTGLNQEEAQEVVALLQEEGVDYRFNDKDGAIRVPAVKADQTRAELLSKGYPKSGFTYDMYRNNAGLMTTESDKKQYTLYDLQDRLGAQIRLFEGVQDAKVTIAEAAEQKYALQDNTNTDASASVVVTMEAGQSLNDSKAAAIKNLIARSVRGLNFTNVAVFDADTMMEVGGSAAGEDAFGSAKDLTALTSLIENNISVNVRRVLEKLYGPGNVAVSVKGTLNMERLIQENTQYSTPEKINEQDKTGLLNREDTVNENSAASDQGAGGVAGADANADTPRYTNQDNTQAIADSYSNSSATREWLYNSVKEQRQVDPGVLENATVGIVINTDDTTTVTNNQLINLVADSAGIPRDLANQSITIVRAPSQETVPVITPPEQPQTKEDGLPLPIVIAMIAGGILILLLLLLLLMEKRRRRRKADEYVDSPNMYAVEEEARAPETEAPPVNVLNTEAGLQMQAENAEMERNEEILNLRMQHSLKLKQNIGEFVDQNPQIAAKLVQSWLRGEVGDIAGNRRRKER